MEPATNEVGIDIGIEASKASQTSRTGSEKTRERGGASQTGSEKTRERGGASQTSQTGSELLRERGGASQTSIAGATENEASQSSVDLEVHALRLNKYQHFPPCCSCSTRYPLLEVYVPTLSLSLTCSSIIWFPMKILQALSLSLFSLVAAFSVTPQTLQTTPQNRRRQQQATPTSPTPSQVTLRRPPSGPAPPSLAAPRNLPPPPPSPPAPGSTRHISL